MRVPGRRFDGRTPSAKREAGAPLIRAGRITTNEVRSGAPCTIRTCDLLVRSQTLYPAELRALRGWCEAANVTAGRTHRIRSLSQGPEPTIHPPPPGAPAAKQVAASGASPFASTASVRQFLTIRHSRRSASRIPGNAPCRSASICAVAPLQRPATRPHAATHEPTSHRSAVAGRSRGTGPARHVRPGPAAPAPSPRPRRQNGAAGLYRARARLPSAASRGP